ncbi:hypothetical protein [Anaerotignum sp.]
MATYTENYGLTLPEAVDAYNIADYNENFESIDTLLAENEFNVSEVNKKLGTPDEGETIFSLLKSGGSIIKSIQYVTYSNTDGVTKKTLSINPVNLSKTIVIFERLKDTVDTGATACWYTLSETSIAVEHPDYYTDVIRYGFWVIEFN